MRLSRIELIGFKSFADKTVLKFLQGITAIVGPNGCGKSNISDAFRWVLGEQSAKSLRGSKMLDVIFAGTEKRKPLNMAEVTLLFTDIEKALSFSEVAITRRLHRSGESEYFINKKSVRLKDVYDFFLDSGVGKDAFAIFEQGKIDQVINNSPLERRYIFEDAAGILRFLIRKKEALRKLEQVELNLARVKDIHMEVERQIAALEEQAVKASEFKEKKAQFEELEKGILSTKWHGHVRKLGEIDQAKQGVNCEKQTLELQQLEGQLKEIKAILSQMRDNLQGKTQVINDLKRDFALIQQQLESNHNRLQEMVANEKKWLQSIDELGKLRESRLAEREKLLSLEERGKRETMGLEQRAKEQRAKVKAHSEQLEKMRQTQQGLERERYHHLQLEKGLESEFKQLLLRLEHTQEKKNQLHATRSELQRASEEILEKIEIQQKEQLKLEEELSVCRRGALGKEKELTELFDAMQDRQRQLQLKQREISEHQARKNVLSRLREEKQGFSASSKWLLKEAGTKTSPLYQKIVPLYEVVSSGNEAAMAAVMRPYAHTLVVETKIDLEEVLAVAVEKELKDFSLICMENIKEGLEEHFLKDVAISQTLKSARGLAFQTLWTEEGIYIDAKGVLFYQSVGENHVFLREAELKKLEKWLAKDEEEHALFEGQLGQLREKQKTLLAEKKLLEEGMRKKEMAAAEFTFSLKRLKADHESKLSQMARSEGEGKNLDQLLLEFEQKIAGVKQKLEEMQGRSKSASTDYEKTQESVRQQASAQEKLEKQVVELERGFSEAADNLRKAGDSLRLLEMKEQEAEKQAKLLQEDIKAVSGKQKWIEEQNGQYAEQRQALLEQLKSAEEGNDRLQDQLKGSEQEIAAKERLIEEKRLELKSLESQGYQLGIQRAQVESLLGTLATELYERYQLEAKETSIQLDLPLDKAERKCQKLRSELAGSDPINMTAIEECEKHKARFTFLQEQLGDLGQAKQELVHIITDLDGQSRKVFKETFEIIRENFIKNFTILFHGGAADLQFTEAADVLEAGIEIVAMPPGKKMQSIQLLSGGEKCLTAMALLFAIFEVKPAPFCILDEIDAPLDDANVERFMRLVRQYESRCQFLIVTHNKETMAAADVLFGVSMQEKGVSKVLAVDFAEEVVTTASTL